MSLQTLDLDSSNVPADNQAPSILFVCTGNICRSPFMELYFKKLMASLDNSDIRIASAGTSHLLGRRIAEPMAEILHAKGIATQNFRAQGLTKHLIEEATLVITAEVAHRAAVLRLVPRAHAKVFTLLQSNRLLRYGAADRYATGPVPALDAVTRAMAGARGLAGPAGNSSDGIPDPWQLPFTAYQDAATLMSGPLEELASKFSVRLTD